MESIIINTVKTIINLDGIKPNAQESYIKIMRDIAIEDWKLWLREEKELSYTDLVSLELFSGGYHTAMTINETEILTDELFKNGGEVVYIGEDIHKFYLNKNLIYTVGSL